MTPYLLILAVLLGIAPGLIAHGKGRNFFLWWLYGVVLGPVALLHAILLRRHVVPSPFAPSPARMRWRSRWPAFLWAATSVAIAIVAVTVYGLFAAPDIGRDAGVTAANPAGTQLADRTRDADRATAPQPSEPAAPAPVARQDSTPTVRVTLRRDPPPEEKVESAPVSPVERMVSGDSAAPEPATSTLERTTPREPVNTRQVAAAERTPPADITGPAITPPTAPPSAEPKVAAVAPAAPVAEQKPDIPEPPAPKPQVDRTGSEPPAPNDVVAVGETVRVVQIALAERGYDPGPANGRAGSRTQAAIRKFQADRNLEATGTIDYALLETLGIVGPRVHAFRPPPGMTVGR